MAEGLGTVEKIVGLVATGLAAFTAFQAARMDTQVKAQSVQINQLEQNLKLNADAREDRKLSQDITKTIFDEYTKCFSEPNQSPEQTVARLGGVSALIEALPDPTVKAKLLTAVDAAMQRVAARLPQETTMVKTAIEGNQLALFKANEQEVQAAAAEKSTASVQQSISVKPGAAATATQGNWGNYDFDVFWCEGAADPAKAKALAETLALRVKGLDAKASGRWRARVLPANVNARSGYRISGYQINYSSPDEKKLGEAFASAVQLPAVLGTEAPVFDLKLVKTATPWYLSVFVCPGARL